jgi:hypothetical protein
VRCGGSAFQPLKAGGAEDPCGRDRQQRCLQSISEQGAGRPSQEQPGSGLSQRGAGGMGGAEEQSHGRPDRYRAEGAARAAPRSPGARGSCCSRAGRGGSTWTCHRGVRAGCSRIPSAGPGCGTFTLSGIRCAASGDPRGTSWRRAFPVPSPYFLRRVNIHPRRIVRGSSTVMKASSSHRSTSAITAGMCRRFTRV